MVPEPDAINKPQGASLGFRAPPAQSNSDALKVKQEETDGDIHKRKASQKKELPLSCQRCRLRKVKCNLEHPCSSCVRLGVECIVLSDMRKKRPNASYVSTLEKQIQLFSTFFKKFSSLGSPQEKQQYLEKNEKELEAILQNKVEQTSPQAVGQRQSQEPEDPRKSVSMEPQPATKIRPVYGPTSVYDNDPDHRLHAMNEKRGNHDMTVLNQLNKDPDILHCLKFFFTWQYPGHNMFVFREAFMIDFFHPKPHTLYCSPVLVLSICALGARMSEVESIYNKSITFYNEARSLLLSRLEHPSITSVQSFLLLAFYDICNGNNSTGWMLSGNAMRMGFDLGFQLHPEVWFLKNRGALKQLDVAIRSRIYWGCYMADHFISLILGRPSLLKSSDATIPETEDLPELDWIDDYKYVPHNVTNISDPLKNIINLINISDNMLNDIFTKSDHHDSDHHDLDGDDLNLVSRLSMLYAYNDQIMKWKQNLPPDLNWDQNSLKQTSDNPTVSGVRYYYYILILCLNRPFVGIAKNVKNVTHLSPAVVCSNAIDDLYLAIRAFETAHGLRRASIFIVYCSILSISVILLTTTSESLGQETKEKLIYFLNVLVGCSKTWALAEKSHKMIKSKLSLQFSHDPDFNPGATSKRARKKQKLDNTKAKAISSEKNYFEHPAAVKMNGSSSDTASPTHESQNHDMFQHQPDINLRHTLPETNSDDMDFPPLDEANVEFFGPPVLMTSDLFNEDWEALFPDSIFSSRTHE
ncbi:hypothetical protein ACI3L0_003491 [Candidozyma auris]|uniref:Zn(2)-C6 fungal-type domain-containing protein n=1 Tax=Candidozyma auris TaxID=498019 RepID=A0A2H1A6B4_CANAR|nr:hypothetical protein B9J08_000902 [[Candida] auris]